MKRIILLSCLVFFLFESNCFALQNCQSSGYSGKIQSLTSNDCVDPCLSGGVFEIFWAALTGLVGLPHLIAMAVYTRHSQFHPLGSFFTYTTIFSNLIFFGVSVATVFKTCYCNVALEKVLPVFTALVSAGLLAWSTSLLIRDIKASTRKKTSRKHFQNHPIYVRF